MSIVAVPPQDLVRLSAGRMKIRRHFLQRFAFPNFCTDVVDVLHLLGISSGKRSLIRASNDGNKECSVESQNILPRYPRLEISGGPSDLRFDKLQPSEEDIECRHRRVFGRFVVREAIIDEEYWTAAWLRAESHWENQLGARNAEFHKRKLAEQEFNAVKRRCNTKLAEKCFCIIAVKKEDKCVKRTILSSIVGTLDFSIRQLLCGQSFPGDYTKTPLSCSFFRRDLPMYGYIANLCVAKYARRQGIASNMLLLALDAAREYGLDQVFVDVLKDNIAAQKLYEKIGFQIFENDIPRAAKEDLQLCFRI
ncbi:hypothetical protein AXF42_Ash010234 [Apostasia shenzhenica]|uniref:N-acetyltransferase domain-containing protein n=1 Tax=Apostasia shenzhenica TaxID=1088818 RepID=A0A2I0A9X7_9ASPA|nr:hypothetical protein AXF42_Ash010234 [Apostasia shenzhenica]